MRLLSERIPFLTDGNGFSVLYSAIGPMFYAKNGGWKCYDAHELVIPIAKDFGDRMSTKLLNLEQAKDWIDKDVRDLVKEFDVKEVDHTTIQIIPQHSQLDWCMVGDIQFSKHSHLKEPESVGACVNSADDWGYILWSHEYRESTLTVLRLREPSSSNAALRGLLQEATTEAKRFGFEKVSIWSPSERLESVSGIKKETRDTRLPCLLPRSRDENVLWVNIERF